MMKVQNKGLLAAAWFSLSVVYIVLITVHIVRDGFANGHFVLPTCLDNHILEDFPIPVAGLTASLFLGRDWIWPRVVLGLAAGGLIFVIFMMTSTTAHHKPHLLYALVFVGCVWTLATVIGKSGKDEQMHAEAAATAPRAASEASDS